MKKNEKIVQPALSDCMIWVPGHIVHLCRQRERGDRRGCAVPAAPQQHKGAVGSGCSVKASHRQGRVGNGGVGRAGPPVSGVEEGKLR